MSEDNSKKRKDIEGEENPSKRIALESVAGLTSEDFPAIEPTYDVQVHSSNDDSQVYTGLQPDGSAYSQLTTTIFDENPWSQASVDIVAMSKAYKEFVHLLGYEKVWFADLGVPSKIPFDTKLVRTENSDMLYPDPMVNASQKLPKQIMEKLEQLEVAKGRNLVVLMGPFKLNDCYMYPLGNYKRQLQANLIGKLDRNNKPIQNHNPQAKHDISKTRYVFSVDASEAKMGFHAKNPIANEAMKWIGEYEAVWSANMKKLGVAPGVKLKPGFQSFDVHESPFRKPRNERELELAKADTKGPHKEFASYFRNSTTPMLSTPPLWYRLNPEFNKKSDENPLIEIPPFEQHAYEQDGDIVMVAVKISRGGGPLRTFCIDLHHVISLESGYEGLPSQAWFDQAKPRPIKMTPEELYTMKQKTPRVFMKTVDPTFAAKLKAEEERRAEL